MRGCTPFLRTMVFFSIVGLLSLGLPSAAHAAEVGDILVEVVDAASGAPVALARILLTGDIGTIGYTDGDGHSRFENVPAGAYRANVSKKGYDRQRSPLFDAITGRTVTVRVRLGRTVKGLKTIGSVSVSSQTTAASNEVNQESPLRFLDGSLAAALGDVPGVTSAGDGFSIEGRDATQTGYSLDGVSLPGVGGSLANTGINADLVGGASAGATGGNGSLGGSVNFLTLQPTRTPQQFATVQYDGHDSSLATIAARGFIRDFGYVVQHAERGTTSPIDGLSFFDASGLRYLHNGDRSSIGDLLRVRWSPSVSQTATALFTSTNSQSSIACLTQSALVPCGIGPGNGTIARTTTGTFIDSVTIGAVTVTANAGVNAQRGTTDDSRRFVAGTPSPLFGSFAILSRSASVSAVFPAHEKHEFSLYAYANGLTFGNTSQSSFGAFSSAAASSYRNVSLADTIRPNARLSLFTSFGFNATSAGAQALATNLDAHWQPSKNDAVSLGFAAGAVGASLSAASSGLPDPASLQYFCGADVATGGLGTSASARERSSGVRGRYEHAFRRGRVAVSAWTQRLLASPVTDLVSTNVPGSYLANITALARSPFECGAQSAPPTLAFFSTVAADQTSRGGSLTVTLPLGGRSLIAAYVGVQSRFVTGGDPNALLAQSITPIGQQIPGTPLHRAGLVATTGIGKSVDLLASASYTDANNASNLPAFTLLNAGVAVKLAYGSLAIVGSNLTNRYPGPLGSTTNAVSYARTGATAFPTLARPLNPRTIAATYTVRIGNVGKAGNGAGTREASASESEQTEFSFSLESLPKTPPSDALTIDPNNENCTPAGARVFTPVANAIAAIVNAAEKARTTSGYPATLSGGDRTIEGVHLTYATHAQGTRFHIIIAAGKAFRSVVTCARFHGGSTDDATKLGVYIPPNLKKNNFAEFYFDPAAGIYSLQNADPSEPPVVNDPEPTTPPKDPYAIKPTCPVAIKPFATALGAALRAADLAARSGQPLPDADVATIVAHGTGDAVVLDVTFNDVLAMFTTERCMHFAAFTTARAAQLGVSLSPKKGLSFSDRFGLYFTYVDKK